MLQTFPYLISVLIILGIVVACSPKSIERLTCQTIIEQMIGLSAEQGEPIVEITDVKQHSKTESKLECSGIAEDSLGELTPILFYESDEDDGRYYGYENLPIKDWDCDYLIPMTIQFAESYGHVINTIMNVTQVLSEPNKLVCSGMAITDSSRADLDFYVEAVTSGEFKWYVGFYNGESMEHHSNTLYYMSSVTESDAKQLLDYLIETEMFSKDSYIDIQLRKESGVFEFRIPIKEGIDIESLAGVFAETACELEREVFDEVRVDVVIVGGESLAAFDDILRREFCMD